ncbi:hypothetical protein ACJMK2_011099 [Sinanodonta woodiana]|uniref:Hemimethylated DNA-binding domain-containing protein n=1 Tax=Sinanodonta woodiana TaxID=1069815 RepID=A0ABD3V701_SINWO
MASYFKEELKEELLSQPSLSQLPTEIIEHILKIDFLEIVDICHTAQTCTILKSIAYNNEIWKYRIQRRWHHLLARYSRDQSYNWYIEYKNRHLFGLKIRRMVEALSPRYYTSEEISEEGFREFRSLLSQHKHAGEFLVDELMEIVHHKDVGKNLTVKYYAEKVLRFLQQEYLRQKIAVFLQLDPGHQKLEAGAVIIAQWCQPTENITENGIADQLDSIAAEVKSLLREREPSHPIFSRRFDCHGKQNIPVLQNKTGTPISLSVVYSALAKRLGVVCEPVSFPSHFMLRWKEDQIFGLEQTYTYVDVFNGGAFMSVADFPTEFTISSMKVASPSQVMVSLLENLARIGHKMGRMGDNLQCLRNALELWLIICPENLDVRLRQIRVSINLNINLPYVMDSLQRIADHDRTQKGLVDYLMQVTQDQIKHSEEKRHKKEIKPKYRKDDQEVEFAVGMIMRHKRYRYKCVIYGWDPTCQATDEWIAHMGVNNLSKKQYQTFYNVLVEDGTTRYAEQENLAPHEDPAILKHPEIGRYYQEFCYPYYLPNQEKLSEYPNDLAFLKKRIKEFYNC